MPEESEIEALLDEEKNVHFMDDRSLMNRWRLVLQWTQEASTTPYSISTDDHKPTSTAWARLQAIEDEQARRWRAIMSSK